MEPDYSSAAAAASSAAAGAGAGAASSSVPHGAGVNPASAAGLMAAIADAAELPEEIKAMIKGVVEEHFAAYGQLARVWAPIGKDVAKARGYDFARVKLAKPQVKVVVLDAANDYVKKAVTAHDEWLQENEVLKANGHELKQYPNPEPQFWKFIDKDSDKATMRKFKEYTDGAVENCVKAAKRACERHAEERVAITSLSLQGNIDPTEDQIIEELAVLETRKKTRAAASSKKAAKEHAEASKALHAGAAASGAASAGAGAAGAASAGAGAAGAAGAGAAGAASAGAVLLDDDDDDDDDTDIVGFKRRRGIRRGIPKSAAALKAEAAESVTRFVERECAEDELEHGAAAGGSSSAAAAGSSSAAAPVHTDMATAQTILDYVVLQTEGGPYENWEGEDDSDYNPFTRNVVVWDPCPDGSGGPTANLHEGYTTHESPQRPADVDVIISAPPVAKLQGVIDEILLNEVATPFALLLPLSAIASKTVRSIVENARFLPGGIPVHFTFPEVQVFLLEEPQLYRGSLTQVCWLVGNCVDSHLLHQPALVVRPWDGGNNARGLWMRYGTWNFEGDLHLTLTSNPAMLRSAQAFVRWATVDNWRRCVLFRWYHCSEYASVADMQRACENRRLRNITNYNMHRVAAACQTIHGLDTVTDSDRNHPVFNGSDPVACGLTVELLKQCVADSTAAGLAVPEIIKRCIADAAKLGLYATEAEYLEKRYGGMFAGAAASGSSAAAAASSIGAGAAAMPRAPSPTPTDNWQAGEASGPHHALSSVSSASDPWRPPASVLSSGNDSDSVGPSFSEAMAAEAAAAGVAGLSFHHGASASATS